MAQYGSSDSGASLGDILGAALNKAKSEIPAANDPPRRQTEREKMTLEADHIAARRRLNTARRLWRIAAVLAAGLAVLALAFTIGGDGFTKRPRTTLRGCGSKA